MDIVAIGASGTLAGLTFPPTQEDWVLILKWAPTALAGLALLVALIMVLRRYPPGDNPDGRAPLWSRLLQGVLGLGYVQAIMAKVISFFQHDAFTNPDPVAQTNPRAILLVLSLFGLGLVVPYLHNSAVLRARGQARMHGPLNTPVIGLLTPLEERICTAYGRASNALWLVGVPSAAGAIGALALYRYDQAPVNPWPLAAPFLLCLGMVSLIVILNVSALWRLNRRSLSVYCKQLVAQGQEFLKVVDGERRREGLALLQRVADLAHLAGKDRLLHECTVEALNAIGDARMVLAQVALEPSGPGVKAAAELVAGAAELRDLKGDEWLRLGWLLASDFTPASLIADRARYGHLLLGYCRAWLLAYQQANRAVSLSAGMAQDGHLRRMVTALEQTCSLVLPGTANQEALANAANAPWRDDSFLAQLAGRPDLPMLLALNEGALELDANFSWARVNAGLCRLAKGDATQARGHLEVIATQRPDDPSLALYRVAAYTREQKSNEALTPLEETALANPGWFLAVRLYAETLLEVAKTPLEKPLTSAADQPVPAERWERASMIIERALTLEPIQAQLQAPNAAPLYLALGMAQLFGRSQAAGAEVWFRRALKVDARSVIGLYGLALAAWEQGQREEAFQAAQETLRAQPQHVPAATLLAQVLLLREQMAPALGMANEGLRLLSDPQVAPVPMIRLPQFTPERQVLLHVKGRAAFELGRFDEAFQALDQVLGRYVDARFYAACALYHLGRYDEAVTRLKEFLASAEGARDYRALLYLGCAQHARGKESQDAALYALDTCLDLAPEGSSERLRALLERGQIYTEREELDKARGDYEAALKIERSPMVLFILAALYHRQGQDQEACDLLAPVVAQGNAFPQVAPASAAQSSSRLVSLAPGAGNEPIEIRIQRFYAMLRARLLAAEQARLAAEQAAQLAAEQARLAAEQARLAAEQASQAQLAAAQWQIPSAVQLQLPFGAQPQFSSGVQPQAPAGLPPQSAAGFPAVPGGAIPTNTPSPGDVTMVPAPSGAGATPPMQPPVLPGDQTVVPGSPAVPQGSPALSRATPPEGLPTQTDGQG
ncbi:MAG TPA: tetratricopeptide repeat protein [Ktedonobacterales bacterium]|jgi:tetratricopeptide (TPR) repeat protein